MSKKYLFPYANQENRCHDCNVLPGEIHHEECDVEKCPFTFSQKLSCDCGKCDKPLNWSERIPFGFEDKAVRKIAV